MRLYFDTNIYSFIADTRETDSISSYLRQLGHNVLASAINLMEICSNPSAFRVHDELKVMVKVATHFEPKPQAWLHAQEVLGEIRRCRPNWIQPIVFEKQIRGLLRDHRRNWEQAKSLRIPSRIPMAAYRTDAERGINSVRELQKMLRSRLQRKSANLSLRVFKQGTSQAIERLDLDDPDKYWRIDCLLCWFNAIELEVPSSRDYADCLCPYLERHAFCGDDYAGFWLSDVQADNMPRNRLVSLINYYQLDHKISHGNAYDQLHASILPDVDLFVTADIAYYNVLSKLVENHLWNSTRPILIDRRANSVLEQISNQLESCS